jgi:hypothetical protein
MAGTSKRMTQVGATISFEKFWQWLGGHVNCILRAGTPEAVLFDHEDFHWTIASEDDQTLIIQLARGKELVGEMVVFPSEIAYVQMEPTEQDGEWVFECVVEGENAREVAYHFVMAHEYETVEHKTDKWTH